MSLLRIVGGFDDERCEMRAILRRHTACTFKGDDGSLAMKSDMSANLDALPERVELIERKLDALSVSVDRRFEEVDKRFEQVDRRFDEVDKRFDEVSEHFVEQRQYTEFAFERLERRMVDGFDRLERMRAVDSGRLERLERKLDQFIDSQSRQPRRPAGRSKKR